MGLASTLGKAAYKAARRGGLGSIGQTALASYGFAIGAVVDAIKAPIGNVATREAGYQTEAFATNHIPDPGQILHAFWRDLVSLGDAKDFLSYHGVKLVTVGRLPEPETSNERVWRGVIQSTRPQFDTSMVVDLWRRHVLTDLDARHRLTLAGWSHPFTQDKILHHRGWFDLSTATDLWWQRKLTDEQYVNAIRREGIGEAEAARLLLTQDSVAPLTDWEDWWLRGFVDDAQYTDRLIRDGVSKTEDHKRYLATRNPVPESQVVSDYWLGITAPAETDERMARLGYGRRDEVLRVLGYESPWGADVATRLFWRGQITPETYSRQLASIGIVDVARQQQWYRAQLPIPNIGQLIHFAVKDAWDIPVVAALGYDQEYPAEVAYWAKQQGYDWPSVATPEPGAPPGQVSWPQMEWRAHWTTMSPSQGYRAFHRLRPDRIARYADRVPGLRPFFWEDLERTLKIDDYPPGVRPWLAASAFAVLPVYVVRRLYYLGKRDKEWTIAQLLDRGFTRDDSESFVALVDAQIQWEQAAPTRQAGAKARKDAIATIQAAYRLGTYTRDTAVQALVGLDVDEETARGMIDVITGQLNLEVVATALRRLRAGFMRGEYSAAELPGQLGRLGIVPGRAAIYVQRWTLQRSFERRQLATGQIVHYVGEGRMSMEVGLARLRNLNWSNPDALLLLSDARAKLAAAEAKQHKADELARTKGQRELEDVVRHCTRLRDKVQSDLRRMTPLSAMKAWFIDGYVSEEWLGRRFEVMGYDPGVAARYVLEWCAAREKKTGVACETTEPPTPAPVVAPEPILQKMGPDITKKMGDANVTTGESAQRTVGTTRPPETTP